MTNTVIIGEFRNNINDICRRVRAGEEITLRHGNEGDIATIRPLRPEESRVLDADMSFSITELRVPGGIKSLRLQNLKDVLTQDPVIFVHDRTEKDDQKPISGKPEQRLFALKSLICER